MREKKHPRRGEIGGIMCQVYAMECAEPVEGSRRLLARALAARGLPEMTLCHGPEGQPFLREGPHISLSHTRNWAAVALGDTPVGVDIQGHRPVREGVPERVMSREEYAWFRERGCRREDFYALWTLKESYYKFLGTGLPGFPNQTRFQWDGERWQLAGADLTLLVWQRSLLTLALCSREGQVTISWES